MICIKLPTGASAALAAIAMLAILVPGCFYSPAAHRPPVSKNQVTLALPYDLAWDAVHSVIHDNGFHINAEDPNQGIIETQSNHFSLTDADCGQLEGAAGKYSAEPAPDASAVYNFAVRPKGPEASTVTVQTTFTTPVNVPMHPTANVQCVSRGSAEARLLAAVVVQARTEHRESFAPPPPEPPTSFIPPEGPSALGGSPAPTLDLPELPGASIRR